MTFTQKLEQGCFLACLHSYLSDAGRLRWGLREMHDMAIQTGDCRQDGVVRFGAESKIATLFGLKIDPIPYHWPVDQKYYDGSLLIDTHIREPFHCWRFIGHKGSDEIVLMDPEFGGCGFLQKWLLEFLQGSYFRLS